MKAKKIERKTSSWSISGTLPNADQAYPHYGQNFNLGVEANTMEEALEGVRAQYPDATFINCHHRGDVHIIVTREE